MRGYRECSASLAAHSMLASQSLTIYFIFKIHGHGRHAPGDTYLDDRIGCLVRCPVGRVGIAAPPPAAPSATIND